MTLNLNCFAGTNEHVSCSSMETYKSLMHMSLVLHKLNTKCDYTDYIRACNNPHQLSYSYHLIHLFSIYTLVVYTLNVYMYHRSIV